MSPSLRVLQCVLYVTFLVLSATAKPLGNACHRPLYRRSGATPGWYTVILKEPTNPSSRTLEKHLRTVRADESFTVGKMRNGYGYTASLTDVMLEKVRSDCNVKFVETAVATSGNIEANSGPTNGSESVHSHLARRAVQGNAPWALAQMSASHRLRSYEMSGPMDYYTVDRPGEGVDIYIIDSGITRQDGGRLFSEFANDNGEDRVIDEINISDSETWDDDPNEEGDGHGTSVASCIGGRQFGIAKYATLRNVKCEIGGKPDKSNFAEALRQITSLHEQRKSRSGFKGSIINMSFSVRGQSEEITQELENAFEAGITLVASENDPYSGFVLPCTDPNVICVGATAKDYTPTAANGIAHAFEREKIDIWAPGMDITMLGEDGRAFVNTGASFSAGYVTGILGLLTGASEAPLTPEEARDLLIAQAQPWVQLPANRGVPDWKGAVHAFANTGYILAQPRPFLESKTCTAEVGVAQENGAEAPTVHVAILGQDGNVLDQWEGEMSEGDTAELDVLSYHLEWEYSRDPDRPGSGDLEFTYGRWSTWSLADCELQPEFSWSTCDSIQMQRLCRFAC